jgi:geranylgeranyl diphosphate synthase, type II
MEMVTLAGRLHHCMDESANSWLATARHLVERELDRALPGEALEPRTLHAAMRYSVLGNGKRLRPLLCLAAERAIGGSNAALGPACAVEMVHAYSLIHDDLPALDNDDLRRGRPTCHKVFGEAMAILAGDALLTLAFAQLEHPGMARVLALAAGTPSGMVAGQVADLEANRASADAATVRRIHLAKTAALIRASVELGAMAARADAGQLARLREFGEAIGLAFQITDDLLDRSGSTAELGKTAGKDESQSKATFPAAVGTAAAEAEAVRLLRAALDALDPFPSDADPLRALAGQMVSRTK